MQAKRCDRGKCPDFNGLGFEIIERERESCAEYILQRDIRGISGTRQEVYTIFQSQFNYDIKL